MDKMWLHLEVFFVRVQLLCCLPRNFPVFLSFLIILKVLL